MECCRNAYDEVEGDLSIAFGNGFGFGDNIDRGDRAAFHRNFSDGIALDFCQEHTIPAAVHRDPADLLNGSFDVLDFRSLDRTVAGQFDVGRWGLPLQRVCHGTGDRYDTERKICGGFEDSHYPCLG